MMKYESIWVPDEIEEKGWNYARRIAKRGETIEQVKAIRWEDETVGFEISILMHPKRGNMLNVTRVTLDEI